MCAYFGRVIGIFGPQPLPGQSLLRRVRWRSVAQCGTFALELDVLGIAEALLAFSAFWATVRRLHSEKFGFSLRNKPKAAQKASKASAMRQPAAHRDSHIRTSFIPIFCKNMR